MRKVMLTTLVSVAVTAVLGQGTVYFANDSVTLTSPPDRLIRFFIAGFPPGTPAFGTNYQVQLYYGASTASWDRLVAVTSAPARLRASTTSAPGTWAMGGFRTLVGFDYGSGSVLMQVRLWDINFGRTFEEAIWGQRAVSDLFLYTLPASAGDPLINFFMENFQGFGIYPEPSSFALVGVGAAMLMIWRAKSLKPEC